MRPTLSIIANVALTACLVTAAPHRRQLGATPDVTVIPEAAPPVVFKDYELVIDNSAVGPDGFWRSSVVAGLPGQPGTFPGPAITASRGENLRIKVRNQLVDPTMRRSTAIVRMGFRSKVHGLFQDPGANEYTYNIPLHEQTGTFWYHAHLSSQYVDGLRGPLVIYDEADREAYDYDVDDEGTIIQFGDWYHKPSTVLLDEFFSQGKKYRMRLINNSGFGHFHVRFEGHPMTVIEADGILHQPLVRDEVEIYAAQRFSVIIDANQPVGNYWIYARTADILENAEIEFDAVKDALETSGAPKECIQNHLAFVKAFKKTEDENEACEPNDDPQYSPLPLPSFDTLDPATLAIALDAEANIKAVLETMCAEGADPAYIATQRRVLAGFQSIRDGTFSCNGINGSTSRTFSSLKEYELVPLISPEVPGGAGPADHYVEINYRKRVAVLHSALGIPWQINGIQWHAPDPPTLLQILGGATNANDFAQGSNTIILKRGDIVELQIKGSNNGVYHPFHLHGHTFSVVKGKDGPPNYINAPQRDVSAVGGGGSIFRFRATNPDWHLDSGLAGK
ncbi:hypothetical protein QFC19_003410 [Naganishia cerealis]|uniref:Uncharacterized protein n=1 Tax=Naganishia cerealis TaxID=610337 RepID=A0ACC2W401_9TREE|nr:hypothetical protein QFC19_003410 [Naganishia cerealis]